jgi:hypothetical protein
MLEFRLIAGSQASLKALSCQFRTVFICVVFRTVRDRPAKPVKLEEMSLGYYPVMLNLQGRHVLFIGGGWETEIKIRGLLEAGFQPVRTQNSSHSSIPGESFGIGASTKRVTWMAFG